MFTGLIESERVRERGIGAQLASVLGHVLTVGAAAYATLSAVPVPLPVPIYTVLPPYAPPTAPIARGARTPGHARSCDGPICFTLTVPAKIDLPIDATLPVERIGVGDPVFGVGRDSDVPGSGVGEPNGISEIVDHPAAALAGNPRPTYPSLLRSAHVEATLSARFVVDTSGRVEPESIAFEPRGDALFEGSVRRALLASRYAPAETQGRRVRMLVRQDFAFRITP